MSARALAVLVIALCLACDPAPSDPDGGPLGIDAPPRPRGDGGPDLCAYEGPLDARVALTFRDRCIEGIVPLGFGLRWQSRAQRIARLGVALELGGAAHLPASCPPGAVSRGAALITDVSGGIEEDVDQPIVFFDYQVVGGREDSFRFPDGSVPRPRFSRAVATIDLEDGAVRGEGVALIDLAMGGITAATELAVVIDGFELTTDVAQGSGYPGDWSEAQGYASRGFGVEVISVEREPDTLRVRVGARFEPGILERGAVLELGHDRAVPVASTRVAVRVLAIAADAPVLTGEVSYRSSFRRSRPLELGAACRVDPADQEVTIDGADGVARAVVGLTRFDLALWPDEPRVGDRLREVSIRVHDLAYDPATGRATMRVEGYASNESAFPRDGVDAQVEAEVALAQLADDVPIDVVSVGAPVAQTVTEVELPMR